jgi:hypothetical protein
MLHLRPDLVGNRQCHRFRSARLEHAGAMTTLTPEGVWASAGKRRTCIGWAFGATPRGHRRHPQSNPGTSDRSVGKTAGRGAADRHRGLDQPGP